MGRVRPCRMKGSVSIAKIAEQAGVTRMTVSLALRNHPRISAATRGRIHRLAAEMGYRPDPELGRLMERVRAGRGGVERPVMVMVTDFPEPMERRNPASPTWEGFVTRAEELGYEPREFWREPGMSGARAGKILRARGVRGVVFSALRDPGLPGEMDLSTFACAQIGNVIRRPGISRCTSDKYANTLLACEELWRAACRRIALVVPGHQEERVEHTFLSGYLVFHHTHRHSGWKYPLVDEGEWSSPRIARWVDAHRPDGIIAAYAGLESVLDDRAPAIALVNTESPAQRGINQRHDLIAAGAVDLVDAQLKRNLTGIPAEPKTMLVRGLWQG